MVALPKGSAVTVPASKCSKAWHEQHLAQGGLVRACGVVDPKGRSFGSFVKAEGEAQAAHWGSTPQQRHGEARLTHHSKAQHGRARLISWAMEAAYLGDSA